MKFSAWQEEQRHLDAGTTLNLRLHPNAHRWCANTLAQTNYEEPDPLLPDANNRVRHADRELDLGGDRAVPWRGTPKGRVMRMIVPARRQRNANSQDEQAQLAATVFNANR